MAKKKKSCWRGYRRKAGTKRLAKGSCEPIPGYKRGKRNNG